MIPLVGGPNGPVRLVVVQVSGHDLGQVRDILRQQPNEAPPPSEERIARVTGQLAIEPTQNCETKGIVTDLGAAGYELVDALYQERLNRENSRSYEIARFIFCQREFVKPFAAEFTATRPAIFEQLTLLICGSLWRVRVFDNPFFQNNEAVEGYRALSVNLEARQPLCHKNGQTVTTRPMGENGRRYGQPQPLRAGHRLAIINNHLQLVAC